MLYFLKVNIAKVNTLPWLEGGEAICFQDWKKGIITAPRGDRWAVTGVFGGPEASRECLPGLWASGGLVG